MTGEAAIQRVEMDMPEPSTLVGVAGGLFGAVAATVAGYLGWRSKKQELLYKERQDRNTQLSIQAKEQSAAAVASAETGFKALQSAIEMVSNQVALANTNATAAHTKADAAVAHAHDCDKNLAFLSAIAVLQGWPLPPGFGIAVPTPVPITKEPAKDGERHDPNTAD